ncbi:MAG: DNA helicase [Chloroflexi bacterium]|nr:DNA helicase [Chloroflexota bacterium]
MQGAAEATHLAELGRFVERLRGTVIREAAAERQRITAVWNKPLAERVADGQAIEGLRVVGLNAAGGIQLSCSRNQSRFREGDALCLNRGSPLFQPRWTVTLEHDDETELLVLPLEEMPDAGVLESTPEGWVLDEGYQDLSAFYLDALGEAGDSLVGIQRILPLLMNRMRPRAAVEVYERGFGLAEEAGLNEEQAEALAQAYATDLAWLIQGPPGTGKTLVLAHLARMLAERGERVLITALTHRAISNALNKLGQIAPHIPLAKIGQVQRADGLVGVENYPYFNLAPMAEMEKGYVIGATPFATRTKRLAGVEFDTILFDEASQVTLPLAVMGMLAGKRYILFGDQKQLPPVVSSRTRRGDLQRSIFEGLTGQGYESMLAQTYRLNTELAEWPSRQFYDGRLVPTEGAARRRLQLASPPPRLQEVLDPARPKVFVDLQHRNATTRNHKEAGVVVDLILALLESGLPPGEVGVVVPYRAQSREIRALLRSALPDRETRQWIVVDTVERMQGQERDVVIVSLTTSNPWFAAHLAEFFFQPERLNVAITRPRTKVILVGSRHVLRAEPEDPEQQASVALLRDLLDSCTCCLLEPPA